MSAALADRITALMDQKGVKVKELAKKAGLSRSHTYRLLKGQGKRGPGPETISALAQVLGVSPAHLAYGAEQ